MVRSEESARRGTERPSVRLDWQEAQEVVRSAHTGIFTTLRRDGFPVATPVWFVVESDTIWITTPERAKKVARARNDPRSSFLVESGERWSELRGVHLACIASVVDSPGTLAWIEKLKSEKYERFRRPTNSTLPKDTGAYYAASRVAIRLEVNPHFLSWDNSRVSPMSS